MKDPTEYEAEIEELSGEVNDALALHGQVLEQKLAMQEAAEEVCRRIEANEGNPTAWLAVLKLALARASSIA